MNERDFFAVHDEMIWAIVVLMPIIRLTVNKFWMLLMKYGCHIPFPKEGQNAFIGL